MGYFPQGGSLTPAQQAILASFPGLWPSGSYLQSTGPLGTLLMTDQQLLYGPGIWIPAATTCVELGIVLSAAGAGGVPAVRMGLFLPDANGRPGALLVDGGTIDASTGGRKPVVVNVPLSVGYVIPAAVAQGSTVTQPTIRVITGVSALNTMTGLGNTANQNAFAQAGVAAGLPANATPNLANAGAQGPYMSLKAA